jgi:hypothetical protein
MVHDVDVYGYDPLLSRKEIEGSGVKAVEELDGMSLASRDTGGGARGVNGGWV